MVREKDTCWEQCVLVNATRQKVQCNYCHGKFSEGVYRMKFHLAKVKNKDIVPCTKVSDHVRDLILNILITQKKKKKKTCKKLKNDQAPDLWLQSTTWQCLSPCVTTSSFPLYATNSR
ncbi:hypothetical protein AXF42_Ash015424 [Apostasia shenzhenica]|uniref:BED-type domain-containing protein n=1 Tax=Apostasia shenzhenica TaxID=1088818 RepID=A0A2H9ZS64_9ASPA|nr:hypothetical protein AXF42_Ash015424 [Apostasia shenzhenica]